MEESMETPIERLIQEEQPSARFEEQPQEQHLQMPIQNLQSLGEPNRPNYAIKEYFTNKDYQTLILVFLILVLINSGVLNTFIQSKYTVSNNNSLNPLGVVILSIIGTFLFVLIKFGLSWT